MDMKVLTRFLLEAMYPVLPPPMKSTLTAAPSPASISSVRLTEAVAEKSTALAI